MKRTTTRVPSGDGRTGGSTPPVARRRQSTHAKIVGASALAIVAGVAIAACGSGTVTGTTHKPSHIGVTSLNYHGHSGSSGDRATSTSTSGLSSSAKGSGASGGSSSDVPTQPMLASGKQGSVAQIPWGDVGSGWTLAQWSPSTTANSSVTQTLYLVDPLGGRYVVDPSVPAGTEVADWSGDFHRAVLTDYSNGGTTVTEVNLGTGATLHEFSVAGYDSISYTRPSGLAMLLQGPIDAAPNFAPLERIGVDGSLQLTFPSKFSEVGSYTGTFLVSNDGTELALGTTKGIAIVSNDGSVIRQLPVNAAGGCAVRKWYYASSPGSSPSVLAFCGGSTGPGQMWLVPVDGTAPEADETTGPVVDEWFAGGAAYAQDAVCGAAWISDPSTGKTIPVPGVAAGLAVRIVAVHGQELEVMVSPSCAGQHQSPYLDFFNPASGQVTPLLGGSLSGGSVTGVVGYKIEI